MGRYYGISLSLLVGLGLLCCDRPAAATSTYTAYWGTLSYTNNEISPTGVFADSFTFSGPNVWVMGAGNEPSDVPLQSLGVPFLFQAGIDISDFDSESGPAMAGGVNYPIVRYDTAATPLAVLTASGPVTLTAGHLTVSTPATVTGLLEACIPENFCVYGGGMTTNPFDVNLDLKGTLTLTYELYNIGPQYTLTSAVFTAVPEPSTWLFLFGGAACYGIVFTVRNRRTRETE